MLVVGIACTFLGTTALALAGKGIGMILAGLVVLVGLGLLLWGIVRMAY